MPITDNRKLAADTWFTDTLERLDGFKAFKQVVPVITECTAVRMEKIVKRQQEM